MSNKKSDSDLGLHYLVSHKKQKVPNPVVTQAEW